MSFSFDLSVDLTPLQHWNTNNVFLVVMCQHEDATVTVWDQRIKREDTVNHVLQLNQEFVEYYLADINKNLKDKNVKVLLRWEVMSTVGFYYADTVEIGTLQVPAKHTKGKRKYRPGPPNRTENY